jgi:hypothetical protein
LRWPDVGSQRDPPSCASADDSLVVFRGTHCTSNASSVEVEEQGQISYLVCVCVFGQWVPYLLRQARFDALICTPRNGGISYGNGVRVAGRPCMFVSQTGWANSEKTKEEEKNNNYASKSAITRSRETRPYKLHTGTKALSFRMRRSTQRSDNGPDHGGGYALDRNPTHVPFVTAARVVDHVRVLAPHAPIWAKRSLLQRRQQTHTHGRISAGGRAHSQSRARGNALGGQGTTVLGSVIS